MAQDARPLVVWFESFNATLSFKAQRKVERLEQEACEREVVPCLKKKLALVEGHRASWQDTQARALDTIRLIHNLVAAGYVLFQNAQDIVGVLDPNNDPNGRPEISLSTLKVDGAPVAVSRTQFHEQGAAHGEG